MSLLWLAIILNALVEQAPLQVFKSAGGTSQSRYFKNENIGTCIEDSVPNRVYYTCVAGNIFIVSMLSLRLVVWLLPREGNREDIEMTFANIHIKSSYRMETLFKPQNAAIIWSISLDHIFIIHVTSFIFHRLVIFVHSYVIATICLKLPVKEQNISETLTILSANIHKNSLFCPHWMQSLHNFVIHIQNS